MKKEEIKTELDYIKSQLATYYYWHSKQEDEIKEIKQTLKRVRGAKWTFQNNYKTIVLDSQK